MDYNTDIKEDLHVKGIVQNLTLNDVFSVGSPYNVDILRGLYIYIYIYI